MRHAPAGSAQTALLAFFVIAACSGSSSPGPRREPAPALPAANAPAFPPSGELLLPLPTLAPEGTRFRIQLRYQGRVEISSGERPGQTKTAEESQQIEFVYVQRPFRGAPAGETASLLILEALRHEATAVPAGTSSMLEIADDRLRVLDGEEVAADLRGAQPMGGVTPRMLLHKPVALLRQGRLGQPLAVLERGPTDVRRLLRPLPLRSAVRYLQLVRPAGAVLPGSEWRTERRPASPTGKRRLAFTVAQRVVGYETLDGVPCVRIELRGQVDAEGYPERSEPVFDHARVLYEGEAFVDLRNYQLYRMRVEDLVALRYTRGEGRNAITTRSRYQTRASLDRLDTPPTPSAWANGKPRFDRP